MEEKMISSKVIYKLVIYTIIAELFLQGPEPSAKDTPHSYYENNAEFFDNMMESINKHIKYEPTMNQIYKAIEVFMEK